MLLDYAATYPDAMIRFYGSDMILHVSSDAAYLVLPDARSRVAGYYFLSNMPPPSPTIPSPSRNDPILVECKALRHVVSSAAEADTGGLFYNGQNILPIRVALQELGHPQPPTPLVTDNATDETFTRKAMRMKRSKSWDMRYHWLRDPPRKEQLHIYWEKGSTNEADYFTKHHSPAHHRLIRQRYIQSSNILRQRLDLLTAINDYARVC